MAEINITVSKEFTLTELRDLDIAARYCLHARDQTIKTIGRWLELVSLSGITDLRQEISNLNNNLYSTSGQVD